MDIATLWIVVLSIATPVAGVVGFAFQLRQVKQAHLQNEKLELEIRALKEKLSQSDQRIIKATNEEVLRLNRDQPMFSRGLESRGAPDGTSGTTTKPSSPPLKERLEVASFVLVLIMLMAYFLFDVYRLLAWVASWF